MEILLTKRQVTHRPLVDIILCLLLYLNCVNLHLQQIQETGFAIWTQYDYLISSDLRSLDKSVTAILGMGRFQFFLVSDGFLQVP